MIRSTSSKRERTPGWLLHGRTCAYMSSSLRSATLTERKPPPMGVVIGPLSATPVSRIASRTSGGSGLPPCFSITSAPASRTSHSSSTPVASRTRRVASVSSGPVPSPGMRTTLCATAPTLFKVRGMSLQEAATQAEELARAGSERELSQLRAQWDEELEAAARSADFRERALAFRAVGMFRWRGKEEAPPRRPADRRLPPAASAAGTPAARGSALLSLELLSRDHPSTVNSVRSLLHKMLADEDENPAVRRLAVLVLKNGSAPRDTIVLLEGLAGDDDVDGELRKAAGSIAQGLKRKAQEKR